MTTSRICRINRGREVLCALMWMLFALTGSTSCTSQDHSDRDERRGADGSVQSTQDSLSQLIQALWEIEGSFEPSGFGGSWVFNGDRSVIIAVARFEDAAVAPLVDCLDNFELARATVSGRPVMKGTMCAEVLRVGVIYEATDDDGEFDANWPGYTDPLATEDQLRAAKEAWLGVLERKAYMIP